MFKFKQFEIEHDRSSIKVGTDGVLLGAWCDVDGAKRVLDVGTGCGLIALMVAQRLPVAVIDAIDIDHESIVEASGNFARSSWSSRLNAIEGDFTSVTLPEKYDLIVSNPPFFSNGIQSPVASRRCARHTVSLTLAQLLSKAKSMLSSAGKIAVVLPVQELQVLLEVALDNNLHVSRITRVYSVAGKDCLRVLVEMSSVADFACEDELYIQLPGGEYTDEFKSLCRDFYLRF